MNLIKDSFLKVKEDIDFLKSEINNLKNEFSKIKSQKNTITQKPKKEIPVFRPCMGDEEFNAVKEVLHSGWIGLGPKTKEFEEKFANYIGSKYAVAVNSATAGLTLALKILGISGKEIITTPMTFVSTNHAILYNQGIPVFCDIEKDTLNIDADKIESLITQNTKGIIVVHYGGHPVDMDKVTRIAEKNNLFILEDVAHGCGSEYKNIKLGSIGKMGVFSFHAVKNLATGDGGMVVTDDEEIYKELMKLRWMGINKDTWMRENSSGNYSWSYNVEGLGFKCHMNDINASIGIVQLSKLEKMNERRNEIAKEYEDKLSEIKEITLPIKKDYVTKHARHNYVIKTKERDKLNEFLKKRGISTGVHYIPNNHYEMYKKYKGETPISNKVWLELLTLPLYPDMTSEDVNFVVRSIKEYYQHKI